MAALNLSDTNFEQEVLKSEKPVLVDFWAEWCGPCKIIGPIIEEIASELQSKLKVAKVNVDEAQDLASKYGIMSIPTLIVFKDGNVIDQIIGAMAKEQLIAKISSYLN